MRGGVVDRHQPSYSMGLANLTANLSEFNKAVCSIVFVCFERNRTRVVSGKIACVAAHALCGATMGGSSCLVLVNVFRPFVALRRG